MILRLFHTLFDIYGEQHWEDLQKVFMDARRGQTNCLVVFHPSPPGRRKPAESHDPRVRSRGVSGFKVNYTHMQAFSRALSESSAETPGQGGKKTRWYLDFFSHRNILLMFKREVRIGHPVSMVS